MKVLVANLGSTSFKYRLFDMSDESQLARGGIDRIGQAQSACFVEICGRREETTLPVGDHAAAVRMCLDQLTHPEYGCLKSVSEVAAIGFKAVFAGNLSGVRIVDDVATHVSELIQDADRLRVMEGGAVNPDLIELKRKLFPAAARASGNAPQIWIR